ncbi:MAG TPA: hypothetical protein VKF62_07465 [Planctomycetota bacterium]|nr:hypothetical protein [Planctomycetota bacterium]
MLVTAVPLLVFLAGVFAVFGPDRAAPPRETLIAEVESQARRLVDRLAHEFQGVGVGTLVPVGSLAQGAREATFRRNEGFSAGAVQWGPTARLRFVLESGERDNGLDDDGDGLVDEGTLELRRDLGNDADPAVTLARGVAEHLAGESGNGLDDNGNGLVDEPGFCLTLDGRLLTVRVTLERPDGTGSVLRGSAEAMVFLRNL